MGSYASPPDWSEPSDEDDETGPRLGDLLSGRLSNVSVDSVAAVRAERERE
jgi:hypothetical protein